MSMPAVRPPDPAGRTGSDPAEEDHSPVFAAWALLLTLGVLAVSVAAVWLVAAWVRGAP